MDLVYHPKGMMIETVAMLGRREQLLFDSFFLFSMFEIQVQKTRMTLRRFLGLKAKQTTLDTLDLVHIHTMWKK